MINCIKNFDWIFFNSIFRVILSVFSLFFIDFIRHFKFVRMYRSTATTRNNRINSFHIRNNVQNFQSRHNLNVMNVCKKNCNNNQITNILQSRMIRSFSVFERMLDNRDVVLFMLIY